MGKEIRSDEPETAKTTTEEHSQDSHCDVDPATDCCRVCGVHHGDRCVECGARGYHGHFCSEQNAGEPVMDCQTFLTEPQVPSPQFCPFCGSQILRRFMVEWPAVSDDDPDNRTTLVEHQCEECSASFWTGGVILNQQARA